MTKTKDLFLNIAANPNMTLEDLVSVGLTSENTVLLDRAQYASNEKVQDMFRDLNGNFDEQSFNLFYDIAEQSYNILATDEANLSLLNVTAYDVDNIFVDPSKRKVENAPIAIKLPNPDRLNVGVHRIGKIGERTLSRDEIAQSQQVLLNPVEVSKGADPVYGKAPNESWFEDFWDTRVMAAWDEDGTHVDPVTGKEIEHKKGDLKLNENGTYYYESLDGRSVYGKQVLNKFNTLTTDGSVANKYDFFDSDDIEQKSIAGSVMKNLALVGSMFIPYVGWGIAAASVVHQSAGLFATLGKMLAGSDSPTLDAIEGWVKSTDRRNLKTEYAQQNMWCWENFIDLIGDTTAQLREQRAIFKFAPGLIKRDFKALSDDALAKMEKDLTKKYMKEASELSFKDLVKLAKQQNPGEWKKQLQLLQAGALDIYTAKAQKAVRDYVNSYYKLGEPIAKAYMTAITVQDTYGEALQAGASDTEATLLTLGYAAAEAALLSTDLGKWIMPELRTERLRAKTIAKKLLELPQETREMSKQVSRLSGEAKKDWAKRLFNIGKDIARAEYSTMSKTVGSVLASGIGEGVEEVSEEILADFSKSCFNLAQKLLGDDTRMSAWNNMGSRYAMSFVGGMMGGGINAAASDYKAFKEVSNMNSQQAMQQLVYMARNNELDDFWKVINKTQLASIELSTQLNDDGVGYKQGTKDDNQDLEAKRALKKQISLIESILNAENAKLDDGGFLSALIKADPSLKDLDPVKEYRMRALSNSATAGRFLNEWNTVNSDIVKNRLEQNKIISKYGDKSGEKYSDEDKQQLALLGKDLKELQKRKETMLDGGRTREYVRDALFEMTHAVKEVFDDWCTEVRYAEAKTGKKYNDIAEDEKTKLKEQYNQLKNSNQYAEQVHELADIYETLAMASSKGIQDSYNYLEQLKQGQYKTLNTLDKWASYRLSGINRMLENPDRGVPALLEYLLNGGNEDLMTFENSSDLRLKYEEFAIQEALGIPIEKHEIAALMFNGVYDTTNKVMDEILSVGFIHPETLALLERNITTISNHLSTLGEYYDMMGASGLADDLDVKMQGLQNKLDQIKHLSHTPILENLKVFQLSTDTDKSAIDLLNYVINKEKTELKDISAFLLDNATLQQFKDAEKLLLMYRSAIVGARTDAVDLDNIVGFNTTLNEISGTKDKIQLAEIDAQTADLILQDIDTVLKRLDYAKTLHNLNTGNKYNVQAKTALNKLYIIHNKIQHFVSALGDKPEWEDKNGETELEDLKTAIANARTLNAKTGATLDLRQFAVTPDEKAEMEKESIAVQHALHKFLAKHIDGSDASIQKLEKLLTYDNFKGLIRQNEDFLDLNSEDIDDSAFVWWLASIAALDPELFYNNYRTIIGEEADGESPIAPIPTQELGVFALTAAVVNGDMFKHFGKAIRNSLNTLWETDLATRERITQEYGDSLITDEADRLVFKSNDFLPNFDNILFIEGIAGSGKSTGVLKSWSKLMAKVNPEFTGQKVIFAHTDKTKAENLAKSTSFGNYEVHDHNSLLSYISPNYVLKQRENGIITYVLDLDALVIDGVIRSKWELRQFNPDDVPKVIVIDEWSHYDQLELELIQRFALTYGVSVLSMGDYDLLTTEALLKKTAQDQDAWLTLTPNRNMTTRIPKLGVSMRTDNEIKNANMYRMLSWKKDPTTVVDLHYYEDETGIYGDKVYSESGDLGSDFEKIKLDVQKMISTLKPDEKIGYVYGDTNSQLYQYLTTTVGVKEHIIPYSETDAHGREALYYIVENYKNGNLDALRYFKSIYTGMTRSELGSIIIANSSAVKNGTSSRHNAAGLSFKQITDLEMLPNTFTDAGTREFSRKRKDVLDRIFGTRATEAFLIKPRTREAVVLNPPVTNTPSTVLPQTPAPTPTPTPPAAPTPTPTPGPTPAPPTPPASPVPSPGSTSTSGTSSAILLTSYIYTDITDPNKGKLMAGVTGKIESLAPIGFVTKDTVVAAIRRANGSLVEVKTPEDCYLQGTSLTVGRNVNSMDNLFDIVRTLPTPPTTPTIPPIPSTPVWSGPLPKGLAIYRPDGRLFGTITGETIISGREAYIINDPSLVLDTTELKDDIHKYYFYNKPSTVPLYSSQLVKFNGESFEFEPVLSGDRNNPEWKYMIFDPGNFSEEFSEQQIADLINEGKLVLPTYTRTKEEIVPDIVEEIEGQEQYEEAVLDDMLNTQPSLPTVQANGPDIFFRLLGFTFNNLYLADEFDDKGHIKVNQWDVDRIDNGYGLHKINPNFWFNRSGLKEDLGKIRRILEFDNNTDIESKLAGMLGLPVTVKWAFISKSPSGQSNLAYRRFQCSNALLEYMYKDDRDVPTKAISALVYDRAGKPILEIPMITLLSPHSIFRELNALGIAQDIVNIWNSNTNSTDTYKTLTKIRLVIAQKHAGKPGYKQLDSIIKLWLFTSNGVKMLPSDWNLHDSNDNLGNIYITERNSDYITAHDYSGYWIDLDQLLRKDRFISKIMMNSESTTPGNKFSYGGKDIDVFRPYTPYVLISDHPSINNDAAAALRYLDLLANPTLEQWVKLVPVSPPLITVTEYLKAMLEIRTHKSGEVKYPYGNKFQPFRIWQAIVHSNLFDYITLNIPSLRTFIKDTIARLENIVTSNPRNPGESNLMYKRRIAEKQSDILNEIDGSLTLSTRLRDLLLGTCYYKAINDVPDNLGVLDAISLVCADAQITGVLCKPSFASNQVGLAIKGFTYYVNVDQNNAMHFPGHGSFRIFGKIDSPTYDLSESLSTHINNWANAARDYVEYFDRDTREWVRIDGVWLFIDDDAKRYYLGHSSNPLGNFGHIVDEMNKLLDDLGILDYNIAMHEYASAQSEAEAKRLMLKDIHEKYTEKLGKFIIPLGNGIYKYGNISTIPGFENYKFISSSFVNRHHVLTFLDTANNANVEIPIQLDLSTDSFKILPPLQLNTSLVVKDLKDEILNKFNNNALLSKNTLYVLFINDVLATDFNEDSNTVNLDSINIKIDAFVLANYSNNSIVKANIKRILKLKDIEDQQQTCINPINVKFKL